LIKGRSKNGPQEEHGRKRKETREINGMQKVENINDNNILLEFIRIIDNEANEETCSFYS